MPNLAVSHGFYSAGGTWVEAEGDSEVLSLVYEWEFSLGAAVSGDGVSSVGVSVREEAEMSEQGTLTVRQSSRQALEPLLISARELAGLLAASETTVWRALASGRIPSPVKIGRLTRWRMGEIRDWISVGCPPRSRWRWEAKES